MNDMQEAIEELETASALLMKCQAATSTARNAETTAINRVNEAQKRVDTLIADMKKAAPQGSDWRGR